MSLSAGTRIGAYEVLAKLGEGGMGEVYRATDTSLKRQVALKVLPDSVAADAERLARFQREAEVLASLNHSHIAQIFGVERSAGTTALVMELVEGEDLAQRIAKGPIALDEALPIARQIAQALEAAHEQGVIHRDLKPANVKVRPDGTVKVLDFGLAKALDQSSMSGLRGSGASVSPTITSPAMTAAGVILGTAAYMSPEQARGRVVDQRADIWAFGCVLFEMLTGARAFAGEDVTDTLAAVVRADPDWNLLPQALSPTLCAFIRRALHKDPRERTQAIGDLRLAIDGAFDTDHAQAPATARAPQPTPWRRAAPVLIASLLTALVIGGAAAWTQSPGVPPTVSRFVHELPRGTFFRRTDRSVVALSRDGRRFAYNSPSGLLVREMGELEPKIVPGTERALTSPFFSPDGETIGYYQEGQLKRLTLSGGSPVIIGPSENPFGVSWGDDNTILLAQPKGIARVSASGGTPELIVPAAEGERLDGPQLLPGGDAILFTSTRGTWDEGQVVAYSLRTQERKVLLQGGSDARYASSGHLLYAFEDDLLAVPFDVGDLAVLGGPVSVAGELLRAPSLNASASAAANYAVSDTGTLVYLRGGGYGTYGLVWVERDGTTRRVTTIPPDNYRTFRLSPDGRSLLAWARGDLWIFDIASGRRTRLTSEGLSTPRVAWHPSGSRIAYTANRNVWVQPVDSSTPPRQITNLERVDVDWWSPDGRVLSMHVHRPDGSTSMLTLNTDQEGAQPEVFLDREPTAENGVFSPDGRFIAYASDDAGQREIYIRPYPNTGGRTTVSAGGGREPVWGRNGELYYRNLTGDRMMAVTVSTTPSLQVGEPRVVFEGQFLTNMPELGGSPHALFDVAADGKRFLMLEPVTRDDVRPPSVVVVQHWFEELKRRVPVR